jgi:hypothetical protein
LADPNDPSPADTLAVPLTLTESKSDSSSATCRFDAKIDGVANSLSVLTTLRDDPDDRRNLFKALAREGSPVPELAERWDDSAARVFTPENGALVIFAVMDGPLIINIIWGIDVERWAGGGDNSHVAAADPAALIEIAEGTRHLLRP